MDAITDFTIDRHTEIERLAALDPIDYEAARIAAAQRLNLRANFLDGAVAKKRRELGIETGQDDGQGRTAKIVDTLPWHEHVEGDLVATALSASLKNYAVISEAAADAIALWVLHTWLVNKFTISPRLAVTSPTKGCGKTTILRWLSHVARRAKRAGSISPPALFRVVDKLQPTLLLDETEKFVEYNGDMHGLMNEGHCKGATVLRVLGDKLELREFAVFGALAFARNGKMPDDLEQRSIVIEMQRRRPSEEIAELREGPCDPLDRIGRMCARWADDNADAVAECDPDMGGVINRVADNWRPLFAIADTIGSDWPERIREAAAILAPRESQSIGPMLLADIKALFDDKAVDRFWSQEICDDLAAIEGRPWAEFGKAKKPITKNQLAKLLDEFHIQPDTVRQGGKTLKGYYLSQFAEAFERYLYAQVVHETSQRNNPTAASTSATFPNVTSEPNVTDRKCEKPLGDGHCYGVTVQKGHTPTCDRCGEPGELLEVYDGDEQPRLLHRSCIN